MIGTEWTATGTIEIEANDELSYICKMRATFEHDPDYGSDLDGRRGTPKDFMIDLKVLSVTSSETGQTVLLPPEYAAELMERAEKECEGWEREG